MLLSIRDFELLQLICWCRNIPAPAENNPCNMISQNELTILEFLDLICLSKDGTNIRPKQEAFKILKDGGYNYKSDNKLQTKERVLTRRNLSAQILFTFYSAGISVFNDRLKDTISEPMYMASFAVRQNGPGNPLGSSKLYGIFCTPQKAFLVLYADDVGVYIKKETNTFHSLIQTTGITSTSLILMGNSTLSIGEAVFNIQEESESDEKYKRDSFAQIFQTSPIPVHFIPLGDAGAQMLRFLLIPNYREAIARTILQDRFREPYEGFPETDAVHIEKPNYPAVFAFDMDVHRIARAIEKARSNDFEKIIIYALDEQMPFLRKYYGYTGKANLVPITIRDNAKILNYNVGIYKPPISQYVTDEGRCFDVSDFDVFRKAGKQARQEGGTLSEPKQR